MFMRKSRRFYFPLFLFLVASLYMTSFGQTQLFHETFDDGDLSKNPPWQFFSDASLITSDSSQSYSAPYACKISTNNQLSAIENNTRIYSSTMSFELTEYVYVDTLHDEAIPCLLRGDATVMALFLLPNGTVQLSVLKSRSVWSTVDISVPSGYTTKTWLKFTIQYDGNGNTTLFINNVNKGTAAQSLIDVPSIIQIGNKYIAHTSTFYVDDISMTTNAVLLPPGKIYFLFSSDTDTWEGLNVNTRYVYLQFGLFSDPSRNAAKVINTTYREPMRDSYGHTLVVTWYMMDGSMTAPNINPQTVHPWISNLEAMTKFRGDSIQQVGDEIAFHYHDWIWSDPDSNGVFYWNQSRRLDEYRNDFIETIGHIIIEGGRMPTAFRSGWHYMDNEWETLIDSLIPYRFEDASPGVHDDTVEPLDNIYDWSHATLEFIPYHPSADDYQSSGNLKGWESRCMYMKSMTASQLSTVFSKAFAGKDQVVTLWSHLAEDDFPQQIATEDSLIQLASQSFPEVKFEYVTATQAMKEWRGSTDNTPPTITASIDSIEVGGVLTVQTDEPLWQNAPLVYVKASENSVTRIIPEANGSLSWRAHLNLHNGFNGTIGIGATDTSGNSAVKNIDLTVTSVHTQSGNHFTYNLNDAFPNPFNPTTHLRYTIADAGFVSLKVFDVLGREIAVLVNERKSPGTYEMNFNAQSLPSGVYFYRLQAGNFTDVKKMVVEK